MDIHTVIYIVYSCIHVIVTALVFMCVCAGWAIPPNVCRAPSSCQRVDISRDGRWLAAPRGECLSGVTACRGRHTAVIGAGVAVVAGGTGVGLVFAVVARACVECWRSVSATPR